jgi:hypothetical protein
MLGVWDANSNFKFGYVPGIHNAWTSKEFSRWPASFLQGACNRHPDAGVHDTTLNPNVEDVATWNDTASLTHSTPSSPSFSHCTRV